MAANIIRLLLAGAVLGCTVGPIAAAENAAAGRLKAVIAGDHRTPKYAMRDKYRHPLETLMFFDLRPTMSVVEIWPGGGWYTEILAPYLKGSGKYYAAHRNRDTTDARILKFIQRYDAKLAARPDLYGEVIVTELSRTKGAIAPPGSADLVLTFRNIHNWMKFGFEAPIFEAMYGALKPGGILGVVEHRADPEEFPDPQALSGYVHEEQVIEMAEEAGFRLIAKSEINANPADTRDHPKGVWTLPPTLRLKDTDRKKYLAIGESDRMTLKFVKPQS
ncbi:MAG: methyltransferase [Hyphomicrobiales bacterium]|nr:methyltransferase [Hyphomicrobiales bacterium]